MGIFDFFSKRAASKTHLVEELSKTRQSFWSKFSKIIAGKSTVDSEVLDRLEELLIGSDVGVSTTLKIIAAIEQRVARDKYLTTNELDQILQSETEQLLHIAPSTPQDPIAPTHPHIILVVGVNGVGKTTTIGKLAAQFIGQGKKVTLGAADTFRAAAVEQLTIWGNRVGAEVVARAMQSDPSSVAHETVQQSIRNNTDVAIIDTAGRLHTKVHLINELAKIKRTIQKCLPGAPQEVLLVLDGTNGQNAFLQAEAFTAAVAVTGIVVTKLDGTSKGGMVLGIADQFAIPIKYIGVGEKIEDLRPFDPHTFISSLFQKW
ncbi:MAG: signal recognition particle-docking protein FtsY [Candidatus Cardinium sp.]|uniref:signal recognition particle-docking protein FtsY n=1 Tax=Cardinium endosymbiont of Dermatophagoides farinae TaxID=2597823 RepID=UPI001181DCAA|nr:signal recognition particle-docking protein FtsY [Cardinium endosymbiont of Dermatophagoides farinae]TSJ80539.1 signal recognition particle-docking protein FtsY [Cardinium endosymbiont of Dermatophagoides farinae]UWW96512.1 MAG: signal recognition particle-docking protein FtsY [Candidatus Cardinium sp.]